MIIKKIQWGSIFLLTAVVMLPQITVVRAEGDKPYLSQEYIDDIVQNAYYGFVSAAEHMIEKRQVDAITSAKKVVSKLKRMAKGDPNRRYVYWRIAELEHQIFLEEEELFLKKLYRTQKEINILCSKFNTEVGKRRPNFVNLIAIHAQMLKVSPQKANELSWLVEDRDRNISREVSYSLEKALLAQNDEKAQKEFEYIRKNRKYLFISDVKYAGFERRMRVKQDASDLIQNIDTYLGEIKTIIRKGRLSGARRNIEVLQQRLKEVRTHIPYGKYSKFTKMIRAQTERVTHIEDSLVVRNLELVHARRTDAAIDYLDNVLRKCGVLNKKIAMVDKAILEIPGRKRRSAVDHSVNQELLALSNAGSQQNGFSMGDVQAKVRAKMDSIRACQQEQARLAQLEYERTHKKEIAARKKEESKRQKYRAKTRKSILKIYTLLENNNIDKANALFRKLRASLVAYAAPEEFTSLKNALAQANDSKKSEARKEEKSREKARQVSRDIYALLKRNQAERAYSKFQNLQVPLRKYSSDEVFTKLKTDVAAAYQSSQREKQRKRKQQRQQEQLAQQHQKQQQPVQQVALTEPQQQAAVGIADDPYAAFDRKQVEAQTKAEQDVMEIYSLLERKQIPMAYKYFRKKQIPLKTYVCKDAYDILESTVLETYESYVETGQ